MILLSMESTKDFLQNEMKQRSWTQADLARQSGLDSSLINNYLSGRRNIGSSSALALAKAFKIPPEQIFRAVGLLPPVSQKTEQIEYLLYLFAQMPDNEKNALLDYMQLKVMILEREGKINHDG